MVLKRQVRWHLWQGFFFAFLFVFTLDNMGIPGGSEDKEFACSAGEPGFIPESGRSPGEGDGNILQYPCLENSMDRGA